MNLIVFGDSWPVGIELGKHETAFGELLHKKLDTVNFLNCAEQGSTVDSLVLQLDRFIKTTELNDCVCVFFITNPTRYLYFKDGEEKILRPTGDRSSLTKFYFGEVQSDQLDYHKANLCVLALQKMCKERGYHDYYMEGWTNIDWKYYGIDKTKFLPKSATEMFGADTNTRTLELTKFQDNEYITPNKYHPNQKGHELIAEELYQFIKKQ
tara:strand:+ start:4303 stop:4932 length:630 start_codon:yes stop_codon:yes gene_type:complete